MANRILAHPNPPYLKSSGEVNNNGQIKTFLSGTTTAQAVSSDAAGTSYGSTVQLDSAGLPESGPIYWSDTILYKVEVYTRVDETPTYALDYTVDSFGTREVLDVVDAGGAANVYTIARTPVQTSVLTDKQTFLVRWPDVNTGAVTVQVDALAPVAVEYKGNALVGGELGNKPAWVVFDGTALQMVEFAGNVFAIGVDIVTLTAATGNFRAGANAGASITSGNFNTLIGENAGNAITIGPSNTAVGATALMETDTGFFNTAVGATALRRNTAGTDNSAVGANALFSNLTGDNNTALGRLSGGVLETGDFNTFLGSSTDAATSSTTQAVVIGYNVTGEGGYTTLGDSASDIRAAHGVATWATVSDERYKKDIADATAGLGFVNALKPRTWNYKTLGELPVTFNAYKEGSEEVFKNTQTNHGFIAQEVKAAIDADAGIKDGFKMWDDREDGSQEVSEAALIPILVKAIQELTARLVVLEAK